MIYRHLSFFFFIFYAGLSLAQVCGEASGITTDPDAPVNPQCNGSFLNTPFLNGIANPYYLDWRSAGFENDFTDNPPLMPSPFSHSSQNGMLIYLWNNTVYPEAPDNSPEDGWELIDKRIDATEQNLIYFILYNKYTGVLRILAATNRIDDYQYVNVNIKFATEFAQNGVNAVAATLGANNNFAQPLDRTTDVINVASVAAYPNNNDMWFHADFPIAYDMCTCTFMSQLKVDFAFVKESHISMAGRSVAVTQNLNNINEGLGSIDPDFLSSLYSDVISQNVLQAQSGALTYKSFSSLVAQYKRQKELKAKLEKDYAPWKLTKDILDGVSGLGIIPDGVGQFTILKNVFKGRIPRSATTPADWWGPQPPVTPSKWTGITLGPNDLIKGAAFLVDKISAPLKAKIDAAGTKIANLGMTTITQSEMAFRGTITTDTQIGSVIVFSVPGAYKDGSLNNCDANIYPMYNEVLGRFALIETPKVAIENQTIQSPASRVKRYALKIDQNVKYKFNPAANINAQETTIDAAIVVKIKLNPSETLFPSGKAISDTSFACRNLYLVSTNEARDSATFITPFVPLNCIGQLVPLITPTVLGINTDYTITEVDLRLLIGYQFNNPNGLNRALEVLTYPTNFNYSEVTIADATTNTTTANFPSNLSTATNVFPLPVLYNTTNISTPGNTVVTYTLPALGINNQPIYNDLNLQTTNYTTSQTIFAWNGITINGDLTTAPGVFVEIIAPDIIIESGSVSPNITLRNADFPFSCPPISEWNGNVSAHCSSALYKANAFRPSAAPIVNENIIEPHSNQVAMSAVPNPFNEQVQIDFNLPTESPINLAVYNILGEQVDVLVSQTNYNSGNNSFTWNASNLPAGLYFVTLQGNDFRKTIKVIKQ